MSDLPPHLAGHEERYEKLLAKLGRELKEEKPETLAYFARRLLEKELGLDPPLIPPSTAHGTPAGSTVLLPKEIVLPASDLHPSERDMIVRGLRAHATSLRRKAYRLVAFAKRVEDGGPDDDEDDFEEREDDGAPPPANDDDEDSEDDQEATG